MTDIKYYPLIDCETDGTEKMPMFPVTDSKSIKAQSHLWLEEVVPHYYRLHAEANHRPANVTKEFLQEHFRKHDSITLYKPNGTAVIFRKQYNLVVKGGGFRGAFKTYDELTDFYRKRRLCLKPVITA